jgi:malate/lactate dehydrogenase
VRAIIRNTNEVLPVAAPMKFNRLPEPVFISVPLKLGNSIGCSTYISLSSQEKKGLTDVTKAIYQTYKTTMEKIEKQQLQIILSFFFVFYMLVKRLFLVEPHSR